MATTTKKAPAKKANDTTKKADGTTDKRTTNAKSAKSESDGKDKETKPKKTTAKAAGNDATKTTEKKPAAKSATKTSSKTSSKKGDDNYTDPDLREKLKGELMAGDKGGKPGQWSARKSQLLAHEYEKAGGGYKSDERTEKQKDLEKWTDEEWQTADGKPAEREDGTTTRYLPKEAWDKLSDSEKKATNAKKVAGSKKGEQHVANTEKAKRAKKES